MKTAGSNSGTSPGDQSWDKEPRTRVVRSAGVEHPPRLDPPPSGGITLTWEKFFVFGDRRFWGTYSEYGLGYGSLGELTSSDWLCMPIISAYNKAYNAYNKYKKQLCASFGVPKLKRKSNFQ